MTMQRTRTARDLISLAGRPGRWAPTVIAVALAHFALPAPAAYGQGAAPLTPAGQPVPANAKPRDPMKDKDKPDTKVAVSEHMTVDLHVKDEDLINVLELLSIQTQKNIVASKGVSGKVTATLYGVTFYQALDAILHVNGFGYIENGNFIYVYTKDELKQIEASLKKRISKVIKLNYLNADDAKQFVEPLLSKDGGEIKTSAKTPTFNIPDKAPVGKNDYALGDTLVVIDFEENVKAIEELVKQIDTKPAQVLVEATILQTALNEANAFGVDFSIIGNLNFGDFINVGGPLAAVNSLIKGGTGASGQGVSPKNTPATAVTSSPGNTGGPGTFKVGVVAGDAAVFVRLLDQVTDTIILSNPKILTLNRQSARVLVGKRVGYLNTTSTETSTTQTVEFLDTGTQLYFRPFVSSEGEIRMELKPQVSAAEIRNVTDAKGAAVTIPDEVTQELVTNVNVKDGQTVVLGGLFTESSTFTRSQVPWVGDIPILGAAFRGHDDATVRSEIIFMITPTIISDSQLAASAERASGDIDRLRTGSRQGLLPFSREKMTDQLNVEAEKYAREGNYERALFNIQRSLSLNPYQPAVYRLRERITNQHEHWNNPSMLDYLVNNEVSKRLDTIQPVSPPPEHKKPFGSFRPVFEPVKKPINDAPGSNKTVIAPESAPAANTATAEVDDRQSNAARSDMTPGSLTARDISSALSAIDAAPGTAGSTVNPQAPASPDSMATVAAAAPGSETFSNAPTTAATTAAIPEADPTSAMNAELSNPPEGAAIASAMDTPASALGLEIVSRPAGAPATTSTPAATTNTAEAADELAASMDPTQPLTNPVTTAEQQIADIRKALTAVRSQVEMYGLMNGGTLPALGFDAQDGWAPLTEANLLKSKPKNGYVGGPNADKVVVRETPDAIFHMNYGWIFNPKTGQVWAAGFDGSDKPIDKTLTQAANPMNLTNPAAPTAAELINAIGAKGTTSPNPAGTQNKPAGSTAGVETENHK